MKLRIHSWGHLLGAMFFLLLSVLDYSDRNTDLRFWHHYKWLGCLLAAYTQMHAASRHPSHL